MILKNLSRRRCLTFLILVIVVALVVVLPVIAAAPKKGGLYVGKTSKVILPQIPEGVRGEVEIRVSPSGKKVVGPSHASGLMLKCSNGSIGRGSVEPRARIKNGKFSFEDTKGQDTGTMTGTFKKGGKVSGTVSFKRNPHPAEALQISCETVGTITYTAKLSTTKKRSSPGR